MIIMPFMSYENAIGITMANTVVMMNAFTGMSLEFLFANTARTCFLLAMASRSLGVWKDEATLIPNIDTKAPMITMFLMTAFWNTSARTTTDVLVTIATGPIIMPVATKMLVSREIQKENDELINMLKISKEDIRLLKNYNMLTVV